MLAEWIHFALSKWGSADRFSRVCAGWHLVMSVEKHVHKTAKVLTGKEDDSFLKHNADKTTQLRPSNTQHTSHTSINGQGFIEIIMTTLMTAKVPTSTATNTSYLDEPPLYNIKDLSSKDVKELIVDTRSISSVTTSATILFFLCCNQDPPH
jgi:hypothetical protein